MAGPINTLDIGRTVVHSRAGKERQNSGRLLCPLAAWTARWFAVEDARRVCRPVRGQQMY
jgi:hypothetical protein